MLCLDAMSLIDPKYVLRPAKGIAIVAGNRLVTIWHVLTNRKPGRHADPTAVARFVMT
jgi:hypothetical protein